MPRLTIVFAVVLMALGLIAYFLLSGDTKSVTALIPAMFGAVFLVLGLVALRPGARKHAMHGAMLLAVLGVAGTAKGLLQLPKLFTAPDDLARPTAIAVQSIMAGLCLVYLVLGIRSFIAARRGGGGA